MSDEARQLWCMSQRIGYLWAVFMPGAELRCPADRQKTGGGMTKCGHLLPVGRPNPLTKAIVRVVGPRSKPTEDTGLDKQCPGCGTSLEILTVLRSTG